MPTVSDVAEAQRSFRDVSPLASSCASVSAAEVVGLSQNFRIICVF